jgi:hypothetical protein
MRRQQWLLLSALLLGVATSLDAQTLISPNRRINWSQAGVPGGIPNRTTICATLNPGASAAQINSAIASCPADQVVKLNAGTYSLSTGIVFNNTNNVTLRGAGPNQTFLIFTAGNSCGGLGGDLCFMSGDTNDSDNPRNVANWTAGYSAATTSITLGANTSGSTKPSVGTLLTLDQLDDSDTDNGALWVCQKVNICSQQGGVSQGRPGRGQTQIVRVTAISGGACPCTVTISPGLYMPNWRASQSPAAWWSNSLPITGSGAEDLSMDHSGSNAAGGTFIFNGYGIWLKNIRSMNSRQKHVWMYQTVHTTVRDSYFYGTQAAASESYATDTFTGGDQLIENNIFQHIASPMLNEGGQGTVHAYNYAIDDYYTAGGNGLEWQQASSYQHAIGNAYLLWEGNAGIGLTADDIHGVSMFVTAFRNYWNGRDPAGGSSGGKTQQTNAVHLEAYNRYYNIIGNVLGTFGYHSRYDWAPASSTDPGSAANSNASVYTLGFSANEGTYWAGPPAIPNDPFTRTSLMRWGNYDTVSAAVRWNAGEVPSGLSQYANVVPADQTLPASLYLPGRPGWFSTTYGSVTWPPIGPDVTGGQQVNGYVYKIPAQLCYENTSKTSGILNFNANSCYPVSGPHAPPRNLRVVP